MPRPRGAANAVRHIDFHQLTLQELVLPGPLADLGFLFEEAIKEGMHFRHTQMDNQLTKEAVRAWLLQRQIHRQPLPSIEQIRRELSRSMGETTPVKKPVARLHMRNATDLTARDSNDGMDVPATDKCL
jgi:hypothetical protein